MINAPACLAPPPALNRFSVSALLLLELLLENLKLKALRDLGATSPGGDKYLGEENQIKLR